MPITETLKKALEKRAGNLITKEDPKARREYDNALAEEERRNAILEYIAACDYPEVFAEDEETETASEEVVNE